VSSRGCRGGVHSRARAQVLEHRADQETGPSRARPGPSGGRGEQCDTGTSPLAMAMKLARRASEARRRSAAIEATVGARYRSRDLAGRTEREAKSMDRRGPSSFGRRWSRATTSRAAADERRGRDQLVDARERGRGPRGERSRGRSELSIASGSALEIRRAGGGVKSGRARLRLGASPGARSGPGPPGLEGREIPAPRA